MLLARPWHGDVRYAGAAMLSARSSGRLGRPQLRLDRQMLCEDRRLAIQRHTSRLRWHSLTVRESDLR